MGDGWFESRARAGGGAVTPRHPGRSFPSCWRCGSPRGVALLGDESAAKKQNKRKHRKERKKRRRRRNACKRLPSGAECAEGAQCCTGTCAENTAFPEFDPVCCHAEGASCVIGRNECCQDCACHCTTPNCVDFNGDTGVCG